VGLETRRSERDRHPRRFSPRFPTASDREPSALGCGRRKCSHNPVASVAPRLPGGARRRARRGPPASASRSRVAQVLQHPDFATGRSFRRAHRARRGQYSRNRGAGKIGKTHLPRRETAKASMAPVTKANPRAATSSRAVRAPTPGSPRAWSYPHAA